MLQIIYNTRFLATYTRKRNIFKYCEWRNGKNGSEDNGSRHRGAAPAIVLITRVGKGLVTHAPPPCYRLFYSTKKSPNDSETIPHRRLLEPFIPLFGYLRDEWQNKGKQHRRSKHSQRFRFCLVWSGIKTQYYRKMVSINNDIVNLENAVETVRPHGTK